MTAEAQHRVRNGLRDKETVFQLTEEAMAWDNGSGKNIIPYQNIEGISITTYCADIADPEDIHGQMTIQAKPGKPLKVRSHHFKGVGSYENRARTYAPFVRGLSRRVAACNPEARFTLGSSGSRVLWLAILVLVGLATAMLALAMIGTGLRYDLALGVAFSATLAWVAWTKHRSNKASPFDPSDPPASLLDL